MKIAFTGDVHLNPQDKPKKFLDLEASEGPQNAFEKDPALFRNQANRWHALFTLLKKCEKEKIQHLVIAGDLIDKKVGNLGLDDLFSQFKDVQIYIIPGNHDAFLNQEFFGSDCSNVTVFDKPTVQEIEGKTFVFLPYRDKKSLIEDFLSLQNEIPKNSEWILVSHGDVVGVNYEKTYDEAKIYYPISRRDFEIMGASLVFLGHIHQVENNPIFSNVFYTGSPCAVSSKEKGPRHFLLWDTEAPAIASEVQKINFQSGMLYFEENLFVFPSEETLLENQLDAIFKGLESQGLKSEELKNRALIEFKVKGVTQESILKVEEKIRELADQKFLRVTVDCSSLYFIEDKEIFPISNEVQRIIEENFNQKSLFDQNESLKRLGIEKVEPEEILLKSFQTILEES